MSPRLQTAWFPRLTGLLVRSLREDVRNVPPQLFRALMALAVYGIVYVAVQSLDRTMTAPGLAIFRFVILLNLFLITFVSPQGFAKSIAEECEQGTLGLLLITGVSIPTLLIGKSLSRLTSLLLLLAAQTPVLLFATSFGGVVPVQVLGAVFAVACYTVLVSQIGLLASVCFRTVKRAVQAATIAMVLYVYLSHVLKLLQTAGVIPAGIAAQLVSIAIEHSISTRMFEILGSPTPPIGWIETVRFLVTPHEWVTLLISTGLLCLSWAMFDPYRLGTLEPVARPPTMSEWLMSIWEKRRPHERASVPVDSGSPLPSPARSESRIAVPPAPSRKRVVPIGASRWPTQGALFAKDFALAAGGVRGTACRYGVVAAVSTGLLLAIRVLSGFPVASVDFLGTVIVLTGVLTIILEGALVTQGLVKQECDAQAFPTLILLPASMWNQLFVKFRVSATVMAPAAAMLVVGILMLTANSARQTALPWSDDLLRQTLTFIAVSSCVGMFWLLLLSLIALGSVPRATFWSHFTSTFCVALTVSPLFIAILLPTAMARFSRSLPWSFETQAVFAMVGFLLTSSLSVWMVVRRILAEFLRLAGE